MAIDIRATVSCSLGTLISGSINDDYVQGTGLVKCRGSVEISGLITPAVGTAVEFSYTRGGVTTYLPRKLRVLSSFADPYRRTTKVELGCKLTYLAEKRPAINWTALDDPQNAGLTEQDAQIITIPIHAASVMDECLSELGISASSNPLTNRFSIKEFDFTGGYVQVLSDLLVSEGYVGYLNRNEVLQVLNLDQNGGGGPVVTREKIIDLGSIGAGQLPGEAVTVSYSSLRLRQPEDGEPADQGPVDVEVTSSSSRSFVVVAYSTPGSNAQQTKVYPILQTSVTTTQYREITTSDGQKANVVSSRTTVEGTSAAAILGGLLSQYLSNGLPASSPMTYSHTYENYVYNENGEETQREVKRIGSEAHAIGQVGLPMVFQSEGGGVQAVMVSTVGEYLLDKQVVTTTRNGDYTKTTTEVYGPWIKTISGQQTITESRDSFTNKSQVEEYLADAIGGEFLLSTSVDESQAYYRGQVSASAADRNNARNADPLASSANGYRLQGESMLELAVGSATAQRRIELSLPYAPDDVFVKVGGVYKARKSDAAKQARKFGRIQNKLLAGNRSGMSLQCAAGVLPNEPFGAFIVQANGLSALYRTNGSGWTFDANGLIHSTDALFWGAVGGTGEFWFPVAPGITTLPATPPVVDGQMTVSATVPIWNETVELAAPVRTRVTVTSLPYALTLPVVPLTARLRVKATVRRVVLIDLPVTDLAVAALAPAVAQAGVVVNLPATTLEVAGLAPGVGIAATVVSLPAAALTVAALAPTVEQAGANVMLPASGLTVAGVAPEVTSSVVEVVLPVVSLTAAGVAPAVGSVAADGGNLGVGLFPLDPIFLFPD